jgi:MFS family permease
VSEPRTDGGAAGAAPARLAPTVIWLGVVSFLTDASSDLIYPLLPRFLSVVLGASAEFVGAVEGVAEATASLFKLFSGRLADAARARKPIAVAGYGLSSTVRPLVALATAPWMVLAIRFLDRVGKGVRGSPRDAMVADVTPSARRGAAYGYHRAMDNAGAVLGPLVGFLLVERLRWPLRTLFGWSALPAALAMVVLVALVREPPRGESKKPDPSRARGLARRGGLARYLVVLGLFTLGNSSDAFLLLRASDAGFDPPRLLLVWALHNAVKALLNRAFGALSDRIGRRALIVAGWTVYAFAYLGFGWAHAAWQLWPLFAFYGLYYALVEGSERALVADLAPPEARGRAFGWFHALTGGLALPASIGFGFVYHRAGAQVAFSVGAALALAASFGMLIVPRPPPAQSG